MILQELSKRVYYMPDNPEFDRPVLGYILGDDFSLMVDCGTSKRHLDIFYEGLAQRNLPSPKLAIITHWHWDHTFGMSAFDGIKIANSKTAAHLSRMQKYLWTDSAMKQRLQNGEEIEFCDRYIRLEYPDLNDIQIAAPDLVFEEELSINPGGCTVQINTVDWTHSNDANLIYLPDEKIYFVGDADSEDFYGNEGVYTKDELQNIIKFWESKDFAWRIHGHLPPMNKKDTVDYFKTELKKLS